jgi:hypothetical protein
MKALSHIITMIESRRMRYACDLVSTEEKKQSCCSSVAKPESKRPFGNLGIYEKIML